MPELVTIEEAARLLESRVSVIRRLVEEGRIPTEQGMISTAYISRHRTNRSIVQAEIRNARQRRREWIAARAGVSPSRAQALGF